MARLIDADKLKEDVLDLPNCPNEFSDTYDKARILDLVDEQPTVDAVQVVRCKDCRWFENDGYHTNCQIMRFCVEDDDYCSRGERRGEQDG